MEEFSELQRPIAGPVVKQERHGMAEDLPQQPAGQVPKVLSPHPLYAVALCELREDGVDAVAKVAEEGTSFGSGSLLLEEYGARSSMPIRHSSSLVFGRVVVAVPDDDGGASRGLVINPQAARRKALSPTLAS